MKGWPVVALVIGLGIITIIAPEVGIPLAAVAAAFGGRK